jgi:Predicted metal-dependent enzyme
MLKKEHITSIGGQAVLEGVMMRGPHKTAIAVRKPDDDILVDVQENASFVQKYKINKIPLVRGVFAFVESMVLGVKSLMFSADVVELEDDEGAEPSRFEKFLERVCGEHLKTVLIYFSVIVSLVFGVGVFMLLPTAVAGLIKNLFSNGGTNIVGNTVFINLLEGFIRIGIFLLYLVLVSKMEDIKTVFRYHGAEHKTIFCYESGEELTVENVRKQPRLHPRCGTNFLLIVMIVSIILFSFISWSNVWTRMAMRLLLLPLVAGVSYEFIKIIGRGKNKFVRAVTKPGLWLQLLTTAEPNDKQIEVAIASVLPVIPENKEDDRW